jgi:hypothetical protein
MENKKKESDPRFQPIVKFYCAECEVRYGSGNYQWDGSDGKALASLLKRQPQLSLETLFTLVYKAFQWAHAGGRNGFCPLQPGFRFREFAAHFVKVIVYAESGNKGRRLVKKANIWGIIKRYRAEACCVSESRRRSWWDEKFQSHLGIKMSEAEKILAEKD